MDGSKRCGEFREATEGAVLGVGRSETGTYWGELLGCDGGDGLAATWGWDDGLVMDDELGISGGLRGGGRVGRIWHGVVADLWSERSAVTGRPPQALYRASCATPLSVALPMQFARAM